MNVKNCDEVGNVCKSIYQTVSECSPSKDLVLIIGGDHSISLGTIPALISKRPSTGVIWVDAHADINTPATSLSGNMHGMPLGLLLGLYEDYAKLPNFQWFTPCLQPSDVVYIGLRDVDDGEKRFIKKLNIKCFTVRVTMRLVCDSPSE